MSYENSFLPTNSTKHLLVIGLALLVLVSCTKESHDSIKHELPAGYYIKYKVDGRQVTFEGEMKLGIYIGVMSSRGKAISPPHAIHLSVYGKTPDPNEECLLEIALDSVRTGDNYALDGSGVNGSTFNISTKSNRYGLRVQWPTPSSHSMKVHINKHAGGWISGTFSGKLGNLEYRDPSNGPEVVTITEGTFNSRVSYK